MLVIMSFQLKFTLQNGIILSLYACYIKILLYKIAICRFLALYDSSEKDKLKKIYCCKTVINQIVIYLTLFKVDKVLLG